MRGDWIFHTEFLLKVSVHYMFRMLQVLSLLRPKRYRITQIQIQREPVLE